MVVENMTEGQLDSGDSKKVESYVPGPNAVDITPKKDGGVLKEIKTEGVGEEYPGKGSTVSVHYVGSLVDGTVFDSSRDRDSKFEFVLGKGSVIKAWDLGIATMKRGELAVLYCKSEYAYGETGSPPKIPANATLVFEVELFEWKGEDLSPDKDGSITRSEHVSGEGFQTPNDGARVEIHLKGMYAGNVFEERDVTFNIGEGSAQGICEGLEHALQKFTKGEKSLITIKPNFAFGKQGNPDLKIPGDATVTYEVEMKSFEKSKEIWQLSSVEKVEHANIFKEKGTEYFKAGKYDLAIKQYKKVISFVDSSAGMEDVAADRKALLLAGRLNLALSYLKQNEHVLARQECDEALKLDSSNTKGLFRRGQAFLGLSEPEHAKEDFEVVLKLEPNNKAAAAQLNMCAAKIKEHKAKEKRIYANMFEKFARKDQQKEDAERRKQPDVLSGTLGEWGDDHPKDCDSDHEDDKILKDEFISTDKYYGCVDE